jgi:hypothetical protein
VITPDARSSNAIEPPPVARPAPAAPDGRQQASGDPEAACRHQQLVIAREICNVSQCEEAEWRNHPICIRRHAEQRARDQLDEQASKTR